MAEVVTPIHSKWTINMETPKPEIKIWSAPKPVGYWALDPNGMWSGTRMPIYDKPTAEQIENTQKAFGWKWIGA